MSIAFEERSITLGLGLLLACVLAFDGRFLSLV